MDNYDVIVIGAGAAGLMAAGQAAGLGAKTLLIEKMERPGRKVRITGKGRCNLTNRAPLEEFITHFGRNGRFLRQAFCRFFSDDLVAFCHIPAHRVLQRSQVGSVSWSVTIERC